MSKGEVSQINSLDKISRFKKSNYRLRGAMNDTDYIRLNTALELN